MVPKVSDRILAEHSSSARDYATKHATENPVARQTYGQGELDGIALPES